MLTGQIIQEYDLAPPIQPTRLLGVVEHSLRADPEVRQPVDITALERILYSEWKLKLFHPNMPIAVRSMLCQLCKLRRLKHGELLFSQGDRAEHVYVVLSGTLRLCCVHKSKWRLHPGAAAAEQLWSDALGSEGEAAEEPESLPMVRLEDACHKDVVDNLTARLCSFVGA